MKRLSILKKAIAVIMCVCTVILAAGCGADSKTASTKKKKVIRIKRESPASSDVSPADSEGDEQNGDKFCKRYMCTDFSGDKLMDRYQEKTGILTEYCDICDMWDCMEYQQ